MSRQRPEPPACKRAYQWLAANYGKGITAGFTGTDVRAFAALVHVFEVWTFQRDDRILKAAVELLYTMQEKERDLAVSIVPMLADWDDEWHVRKVLNGLVVGIRLEPYPRAVRRRNDEIMGAS